MQDLTEAQQGLDQGGQYPWSMGDLNQPYDGPTNSGVMVIHDIHGNPVLQYPPSIPVPIPQQHPEFQRAMDMAAGGNGMQSPPPIGRIPMTPTGNPAMDAAIARIQAQAPGWGPQDPQLAMNMAQGLPTNGDPQVAMQMAGGANGPMFQDPITGQPYGGAPGNHAILHSPSWMAYQAGRAMIPMQMQEAQQHMALQQQQMQLEGARQKWAQQRTLEDNATQAAQDAAMTEAHAHPISGADIEASSPVPIQQRRKEFAENMVENGLAPNLYTALNAFDGKYAVAVKQRSASEAQLFRQNQLSNQPKALTRDSYYDPTTGQIVTKPQNPSFHNVPGVGLVRAEPEGGASVVMPSASLPTFHSIKGVGLVQVPREGGQASVIVPEQKQTQYRTVPGVGLVSINPDGGFTTAVPSTDYRVMTVGEPDPKNPQKPLMDREGRPVLRHMLGTVDAQGFHPMNVVGGSGDSTQPAATTNPKDPLGLFGTKK